MQDLVIVGGGPGGYVAAIRARQLGMTTTLIEQADIGGTCLNRGCIPTKTYCRNSEILNNVKAAAEFGVTIPAGKISFSLQHAYERKEKVVKSLVQGIQALLKSNGVEVVEGQAQVEKNGQVRVNDRIIKTKNILLANGSLPAKPDIPGINLPDVLDSTSLLDLQELPGSMVIIGGGVISLEFACIFNAFGTEVTVLEYTDNIFQNFDREIVKRFNVLLKKQGVNLITNAVTKEIRQQQDGLAIDIHHRKTAETSTLTVEKVLLATGRKACLDGIDETLGLQLTERGFIKVDETFATNVQGIYAVGDVIGGAMLAHVASAEGVAAVEKMAGHTGSIHYQAVPACIFTIPEISTVGITEEEAKKQNLDYKVGKFLYIANGKALGMGETDGLVKIIVNKDDEVIGVHILGAHASDLILEGTLAIKERIKLQDLYETIHPHPTLGEIFYEALLDVNGQAIHKTPGRR